MLCFQDVVSDVSICFSQCLQLFTSPQDILDLVRDVAQAAPSVSIAPAEAAPAAPEAAPLPVVEEAKVEEKTTPDVWAALRCHGISELYLYLIGGFKHEFYCPFHIWVVILPNDELIFFRWVAQPPTRYG